MSTVEKRLEALFADREVVRTNELAEAMYVVVTPTARVRSIKHRAKAQGISLEHVGHDTWIWNR